MSTQYYSFAGSTKGKSDPQETFCVDVEGEDCGVDGCLKDNCQHTVIMWSGNEYSKKDTWIAGTEKSVINLEDAR